MKFPLGGAWPHARHIGLALCLLQSVSLSGCDTINGLLQDNDLAGPAPAYDIDQDISALNNKYALSNLGVYIDCVNGVPNTALCPTVNTDAQKQAARDSFVNGRLVIIDLQYDKYVSRFPLSAADVATLFDITKIAVDGWASVTGSQHTGKILALVSGSLTASRLSLDKNYLDQQTTEALVAQMNAQRKTALVPILQGLQETVSKYSLTQAVSDLQNYTFAGTMVGALQGVQQNAAKQAANGQSQIDQYRNGQFGADAATDAINAWLYTGLKSFNDNGDALDASGNKITAVPANVTNLKAWIFKRYGAALPIGAFLSDKDFADDRKQAISDLTIPMQ